MKSSSRFYSSLGLLIFLNAIIKPIWIFGIDREVQNQVGSTEYGTYFSLFSLSVVLSFVSDFGFTAFFNRQLAARDQLYTRQPGNFLLVKLQLALLFALVVAVIAWVSGIRRWDIVIYLTLLQIFTSLFLYFRSIITAQQWFGTDAWLSILDKGLMVLLCGILIYLPGIAGPVTVARFAALQAFCMGFAMLAAAGFVIAKRISFALNKDRLPYIKLLRQVLPYGIVVLLMSAHARLDAFLLERIHPNGAHEAGVYAGAYRLLDSINTVGYLVASFLLPFLARQWSEKKDLNTAVLISRHFLMMLSAGVISIGLFLAPWVQNVLYHHTDANAVSVLQYCLPALLGYALTQVYGTLLTASGHILAFCKITLLFLVLNVALNLFLIPIYGALGCCYSAIITQLAGGIVTMAHARRKLRVDLDPRSLIIYIFTIAVLGAFFYFCQDWPIPKWLLITAAVMISFAIILAAGLIRLKAVRRIWRPSN